VGCPCCGGEGGVHCQAAAGGKPILALAGPGAIAGGVGAAGRGVKTQGCQEGRVQLVGGRDPAEGEGVLPAW
jgi:hypothetical protein